LFGVAVALGALGRLWSGLAVLLSRLTPCGTAAIAAVSSVLVNNLPAASLLADRTAGHPLALLIGLNLAPNLVGLDRDPVAPRSPSPSAHPANRTSATTVGRPLRPKPGTVKSGEFTLSVRRLGCRRGGDGEWLRRSPLAGALPRPGPSSN
jgi:hypothetical protein